MYVTSKASNWVKHNNYLSNNCEDKIKIYVMVINFPSWINRHFFTILKICDDSNAYMWLLSILIQTKMTFTEMNFKIHTTKSDHFTDNYRV